MKEIALHSCIKVPIVHAPNHRVIHVHDRQVLNPGGLVRRPIRLLRVRVGYGVWVEVDCEAQVPILHNERQCAVQRWRVHPVDGKICGEEEGGGRAVQLATGTEDQFVHGLAPIRDRGGHVVGGTVYDEVAEQGLALEEGAVVVISGIQLVKSGEEGLLCGREEGLEVRGLLEYGGLRLVGEDRAFVAVAVDEERHLAEVTLLEFVGWEVTNDIAIDTWSVVEVAVPIVHLWHGVITLEVRCLGRR